MTNVGGFIDLALPIEMEWSERRDLERALRGLVERAQARALASDAPALPPPPQPHRSIRFFHDCCIDRCPDPPRPEPMDSLSLSWIPAYMRASERVLTRATPQSRQQEQQRQQQQSAAHRGRCCFNCGESGHDLARCSLPHNAAAIAANRAASSSRRARVGAPSTPFVNNRYFGDDGCSEDRPGFHPLYPALAPGVLTPALRAALGLAVDAPPPWLPKLRDLGYPPGFLRRDAAAALSCAGGDGTQAERALYFDDGEGEQGAEVARGNADGDGAVQASAEAAPTLDELVHPLPTCICRARRLVPLPGVNAPLPQAAAARAAGWPDPLPRDWCVGCHKIRVPPVPAMGATVDSPSTEHGYW